MRRPFVGRHPELEVVAEAVAAAAGGRGSVLLVAGEAGIGKTRLAEEGVAQAGKLGGLVLWGRAGVPGATPPFWPWLQVIRAYLTGLEDDDRREHMVAAAPLAHLLPELGAFLPPESAPRPVAEGDGRTQVFEAVLTILRLAAARQPVLIVLDDLHDMDASSLQLLRYVSHQLGMAGVVVVGTYRDQELKAGTVGRAVIREVLRLPHARGILLRGLVGSDVETYIRDATGEAVPSALIGRLVEETAGNALFITELVRQLDVEGRLTNEAGASARLTIPETLREVIREQIDDLPDECQEVLQGAAVVGREFDLGVLQHVADRPEDDVLEQLDAARAAGVLLAPDDRDVYRFSHGLVRDVIYEKLSGRKRQDLHRRVAEALETTAGVQVEERAAEIAHHLIAAGPLVELDRTVRFVEMAGEHALSRVAYEEAARLFAAALKALQRSADDRRRLDLLLGLGEALARSGDAAAAKKSFFQAAALARRLDLPEQLARAALGYGGRFVWEASRGDPHLASLLADAIAAADRRRDALHARLLARLAAGPLRDDPDRSRRERLSAEAVEIAEEVGDLPTLAYVLDGRYAAIWGPDALDERMAIARRLVETSRRIGDRERELQGHHYLSLAFLEAGDLGGAERHATEQRMLARDLKQPAQLLYAMTVDTTLAVLQGRYDEAAELIPQATAVGQRAEQAMSVIYSLFERYMIARDRGSAASLLDELLAAAARFPTYAVLQTLIADAYVSAGRKADAHAVLRRLSASAFSEIPRNDEWLFAMTMLADVACEVDDRSAASILYDLLLPFQERVGVSAPDACTGAVAHVLGRIRLREGAWDEAREHLQRALDINQRLNARGATARTRYQLAELLFQTGSENAAVEQLTSCSQAADELGMEWLAEAARNLLAGRTPSRAVSRTFVFTDIVRSTELVAAIGDEAWENVVRWHDQVLRELFAAHAGDEIDHAGDGFFVAFSTPRAAIECGIAIQRRLAEHRRVAGFAPEVRIGIHADQARSRVGTYTGSGVHRAARIAAAAAGGEILVSQATLSGANGYDLIEKRSLQLKGFRDPLPVVQVAW